MSDHREPGHDPDEPNDDPLRGSPPWPSGGSGEGEDSGSPEVADTGPAEIAPTPLTQQVGRVTVVVLAVLFGIFAVANAQRVDFSWVFGGTEVVTAPDGDHVSGGVPLIVLLLVSFVLGAVVGAAVVWQVRRARRARRREER